MIISFLLSLMVGLITWTLLEYLLHRFWGHESNPKKWWNVFTKLHLKHHAVKGFYADFPQKVSMMIAVTAISYPIVSFLTNPLLGYGFAVGILCMAAFYEHIHFTIHDREPKNSYELWARKHHLSHHFTNPQYNHGVTNNIWDKVFGTYLKIDTVAVPRPLCNDWLLDKEGVKIKDKWSQHFCLKGFQA